MKAGPRNTITDVPGLQVGTAEDTEMRTGVTVILPDQRAVAAVDVRGGGTGTQPPAPSWGRMLFDAQTLMTLDPKLALLPGLAIALSVLGLNLLGDGLRDGLDPRLRSERVGWIRSAKAGQPSA
jgi:L-aminopeptidase/D-esterase-like protein